VCLILSYFVITEKVKLLSFDSLLLNGGGSGDLIHERH
jgi:hypothetical protein